MSKVNILYDKSMYDHQRDCFKKELTPYPCVYTISQKDGLKCFYSYINKGHFGIPKVIWSNGSGEPILDETGKYGLTEFAYAIIDDTDKLKIIKDAMLNKDFLNLMKYTIFKKDNIYNYKIIALFRKDFYTLF